MGDHLAYGEVARLADFIAGLDALSREYGIWLAEYEPLHARISAKDPEDGLHMDQYQVVRMNREPFVGQPGFHYVLDLTEA